MSEEKTSTADLAKMLRRIASNGSLESAAKTIRASVLTNIADALDENTVLREENERLVVKLNVEHIVRQNVEAENARLKEDLEGHDQAFRDSLRQETKLQAKSDSENAKLRTLAEHMAKALGAGSEWCYRDCYDEFDCDMQTCPIVETMQELGLMEGGSDEQPTNG